MKTNIKNCCRTCKHKTNCGYSCNKIKNGIAAKVCNKITCKEDDCNRYEPDINDFLDKLKTVSISSKATPTRGKK